MGHLFDPGRRHDYLSVMAIFRCPESEILFKLANSLDNLTGP